MARQGALLYWGQFTSEISDANPALITPAGFVFGIWGIIYLLLGVFVIYQGLPRDRTAKIHKQIGWQFATSSVVNALWLFAWQYEYLLVSVILMFLLLGTLSFI
jgi:hypothetical protein